MDSNTGGDYRALSGALSAPLGTEKWIPHHLFLSIGTKVVGGKTVAAICLHVSEMSMKRFKRSSISVHKTAWDNADYTWTLFELCCSCIFFNVFFNITNKISSMSRICSYFFFFWYSRAMMQCYTWIIITGDTLCCYWIRCTQTPPHTVATHSRASHRHNKAPHYCEGMLGCLVPSPHYSPNCGLVTDLIIHKPSRLKEYVSDIG